MAVANLPENVDMRHAMDGINMHLTLDIKKNNMLTFIYEYPREITCHQ